MSAEVELSTSEQLHVRKAARRRRVKDSGAAQIGVFFLTHEVKVNMKALLVIKPVFYGTVFPYSCTNHSPQLNLKQETCQVDKACLFLTKGRDLNFNCLHS